MSKIKCLTIVCSLGTKSYFVGSEYNGMVLDKIKDNSLEFEDSITYMYDGYTKDDEIIFRTVNAPTEVEYEKAEQ
jgi:hypothetical protein